MPYIPYRDREEIDEAVANLAKCVITPGEYNYAVTQLCQEYLRWLECPDNEYCHRTGYDARASVLTLLERVRDEFNRRVMVPYEERKCEENGDVY